jgi:two-component system KDP operon response regulator KdpE
MAARIRGENCLGAARFSRSLYRPARRRVRPRALVGDDRPDFCVVIVEDEPQIRRFLRAILAGQGYRVHETATGAEGLVEVASRRPDVVILDLGLPDIDGADVIRKVREWSVVPIIVVSAREREADKVAALDAGADDYLSKPFGVGELMARMRVALRHHARVSDGTLDSAFSVGELHVDLATRRVTVGGLQVHLTPIEYRLLVALVHHAGKVVTHRQLLQEVWGPQAAEQAHYLRVYIGHLRRKLEGDAAQPRYLLTEAGVGYRLAVD